MFLRNEPPDPLYDNFSELAHVTTSAPPTMSSGLKCRGRAFGRDANGWDVIWRPESEGEADDTEEESASVAECGFCGKVDEEGQPRVAFKWCNRFVATK